MDDNDKPVLYGVSHLDGVTPIRVTFDSVTRGIMTDAVTAIAFDPSIDAQVNKNSYPLAKATSSADNRTTRPWVVNATTGAVLVDVA